MRQHVVTVISSTSITFALVMNNEQELDDVKYFPRQWLQHWLEHLRQLHGSLTFLHTKGGLSSRYTEIEPAPDPDRYDFEKFTRVLEGMCAYEDEEDFVKFGSERLRELYRFHLKHGKVFREQYKRKK